jgi:SAM-dependent methyltransferase
MAHPPRVAWTFPADVEAILWDATRAEVGADAVELRVLLPAIAARTRRYTDARETLHAPLSGPEARRDLAARALFFTVADAAKLHIPLAELAGRGLLPERPLRVLDAGAGVGAMTLGLLSFVPRAHDIVAVDRERAALAILRRVAAAHPVTAKLETVAADVSAALPDGRFDLVLAGSLFNELPASRGLPLARALLSRVAPEGSLILVEPALRETARALHELRDALLAERAAAVFAPCTRAGPCPALADPRDWCHEDRPFQPPPRLADLARRTGLRTHGLKLAYLTMRHDGATLVAAPGRRALRVVSGALDSKGAVERITCGEDGWTRRRELRRDRDRARSLAAAERGDVLLEDEGGATTRIRPASPLP